jgi:hypothetical protein
VNPGCSKLDAQEKIARPSPGQVAATLGPFALLISAALLVPAFQDSVLLLRVKYTVWVSILFATPAYALFVRGVDRKPFSSAWQHWRLLWTFAFLAYATHFYYAFVVTYRSSFAMVAEQQTPFLAGVNFLFTAWWAVDVAILWSMRKRDGWVRTQRIVFQFFSFIVFVVAFVFLRPGMPFYFGLVLVFTVLVALLVRMMKQRSPARPG